MDGEWMLDKQMLETQHLNVITVYKFLMLAEFLT